MSRLTLPLLVVLAACGNGPRITLVEPPVRAEVVVTPATAVITWEKGLNAQSTLIARTLGTVDGTRPDGGLAVGDLLGAGVVVHVSEDVTFTDNHLPDTCGPFAWHLWSQAADGTWSKLPTTVRSLRGAQTLAPTAEVTQVTAVFDNNQLRLSWMPPEASTAFEGVTVLRKRGSAPASITDGIVVYSGPSSSTTDALTNLSPSEPTFYGVFNCNSCGKCGMTAPSLSVLAPGDGGTTLSVTGFTAQVSADGQRVELAWSTTAPKVKVLRTLNAMPTGPNDASATVVFDGAGASTSDRLDRLLPDLALTARRYTYTAWGCVDATCSLMSTSAPFRFGLKQALRGGGYTLFFRHATAATCADQTSLGNASTTTSPSWWKSCNATCATATAAQLTPATSDAELAAVQSFFSTNGVPVSRVLSSEFCRANATAAGFGLDAGVIEQVQALTYFVYDEPNRCRDATSLLNAPPAMGTNVVHVGHVEYPASCPVLDSLNFAEAVIYRPQLGAPPLYVARVAPTQWATLP